MSQIRRTGIVKADIDTCFDFIADPEKAPVFVSSLHSITTVAVDPKGVGNKWNWEYDMFGVPLTGLAECIEYDKPNRYVWRSSGGADSTWTYSFKEADGGTEIALTIEYQVPQAVLGGKIADKLIVEKLNEHEAENAFKNLKTVLES